jgi:MFS family permease
VGILLLGRALLGVGESFIIAGGQSWALAILTVRNTSKALAWVGSAMFAAFAAGALIGSALYIWRDCADDDAAPACDADCLR